jgi:predicted MPP superfamily phosphohydrolase
MDEIVKFLTRPHWRRQHGWRRAIWQTMNRLGLTGMHALPMSRRWVDIHRRTMPLAGLDPTLEGLKLVQISDLHHSPVVWKRYLIQYLAWVNEIEPDVVVVTGDLITGGYRYAHRIATILRHLKAPLGVICTFGNHDYSIYGKHNNGEGNRRGDYLEKCLKSRGLIVLRNQTHYLRRDGTQMPLVIVGLDDEWSGRLDAVKAWAGINSDQPIICLNHNPANALELMSWPWQWMLSGHTHGRQVGTSAFGRRFYPHRYRHYTHGYYAVQGRHLYVNRGLSYGQRVLDWCRPEITVFKLTSRVFPPSRNVTASGDNAAPP